MNRKVRFTVVHFPRLEIALECVKHVEQLSEEHPSARLDTEGDPCNVLVFTEQAYHEALAFRKKYEEAQSV